MTALSVLVTLCAFLSIQLVFETRLRLLPWLSKQLNHSICLQSAVVSESLYVDARTAELHNMCAV